MDDSFVKTFYSNKILLESSEERKLSHIHLLVRLLFTYYFKTFDSTAIKYRTESTLSMAVYDRFC